LENVTVTDTDENGTVTLASGLSLAPDETVELTRFSKTWPVGSHTNTVNATGESTLDDSTATAVPATAVATVLEINIECSIELTSTFDLDNNPSDNHVTLPTGSVDTPVEVTLTLENTGTADLIVTNVDGLPPLVDCADDVTPVDAAVVLGLPLTIPAGSSISTPLGCWLVSCPSASFTAVAHAIADSEEGTLCVFDSSGNIITDSSPGCSADVSCEDVVTCRTTGGGTLYNGDTDQSCKTVTTTLFPLTSNGTETGKPLDHISHGGQLGAPFAVDLCPETADDLGNPCIRGQWQHTRHYVGKGNPRDVISMNFHSNTPKACLTCTCAHASVAATR
jgi:hypothetical protein